MTVTATQNVSPRLTRAARHFLPSEWTVTIRRDKPGNHTLWVFWNSNYHSIQLGQHDLKAKLRWIAYRWNRCSAPRLVQVASEYMNMKLSERSFASMIFGAPESAADKKKRDEAAKEMRRQRLACDLEIAEAHVKLMDFLENSWNRRAVHADLQTHPFSDLLSHVAAS